MRLETPVMYFYPSDNFDSLIDVDVRFSGGWITQFYPAADVEAFGMDEDGYGPLKAGPYGTIRWAAVALTRGTELPATGAAVWTTPRLDEAATVEAHGEHEKFLFYRGVSRIDAPLHVVRSEREFTITKRENDTQDLWLVDVRDDGAAAFRAVHPFNQAPGFVVKTATTFDPSEYSHDAVPELKSQMRAALIAAGLFANEADALLFTWSEAYFKHAGLRLFFLVPPKWTDEALQLRIRLTRGRAPDTVTPLQITRVMVGRIELVTPEQVDLLARMSALAPRGAEVANDEKWQPVYALYQRLGRFRNALLLFEQHRNARPALAAFIERYHLQAYTPTGNFEFHRRVIKAGSIR
jgi:hypothetical protein